MDNPKEPPDERHFMSDDDSKPDERERLSVALTALAAGLRIASDVVDVCPKQKDGSRPEIRHSRLRWGAFLLAYAPFEAFLKAAREMSERQSDAVNFNALAKRPRIDMDTWISWTIGPNPSQPDHISWRQVQGKEQHHAYGTDLRQFRNALAHGREGIVPTAALKTDLMFPRADNTCSVRLIGVCGMIRFIEDVATHTALNSGLTADHLPVWPMPETRTEWLGGDPPRPV